MCRKCLFLADGDVWMPVHRDSGMFKGGTKRAPFKPYDKAPGLNFNKIRFGSDDDVTGWKRRPSYRKDERIEFDPDKTDYTARELEQLADQFLRDDARTIGRCDCPCDECKVRNHCGLIVCAETGKERGIGGEDPILFAEHLYQRQKREILNENGVPEPGLVQGMYYRTHPEGRKVNSEEQRKRHGASFYRVVPFLPLPGVPWYVTVLTLSIGLALNVISRVPTATSCWSPHGILRVFGR